MKFTSSFSISKNASIDEYRDVAQGVALPNVTLINPFYIGPYEGYFYVCLGCHNLHLHYKRLSNLAFLVSREYKNTFFFVHCFILNVKLKINSLLKICEVNISKTIFTYTLLVSE
jgi:hypothetical protein